jgi:polysaccharide biosynthesis/export protein
MTANFLLSLFLALTLAPQAPAAQTSAAPPAVAPGPAPAAPQDAARRGAPESYQIGPNDTIDITVFGEPELTNKYHVDESGAITFPMIGRVMAGGKRIVQFQEDLAKQLSNGFLNDPQVRVDVDTYKSQSVIVSGAVRAPGKIQMTGQLSLLNALIQAGSPNQDASDDIQIVHSKGTTPSGAPLVTVTAADNEPRHVSFRSLQLGRGDIALQDGDIVFVPAAQHFTMTGQVRNSGSYVWESDLTAEQAVARAGGITERGSMNKISAHRMVDGKMKDVHLNPQDKIQPGDTIKVDARLF